MAQSLTVQRRTIRAIALIKLFKGVLLLMLGLGALELMHADVATLFSQLIENLHLNADSRVMHALILKVDALQPWHVRLAAVAGLGYSVLLLAEGTGLWFRRSWAAYMTVVSTSVLLPFELYELIERVTVIRFGALILNTAIVVYLARQVRRHAI